MVSTHPAATSPKRQLAALADTFSHWLVDLVHQQKTFTAQEQWFYQQSINRFVQLGQQLIVEAALAKRNNLSLNHNPYARSGLLLLRKSRSTPIHDHADATAFSLLLNGRARIDLFSVHNQQRGDALISHVSALNIEAGMGVWAYPRHEPSLHRLTGLDDDSLFLDFQFPAANPARRSFYFIRQEIASKHYRCNVLSEKALAATYKQQQVRSYRKCIPRDSLQRQDCCSMAP